MLQLTNAFDRAVGVIEAVVAVNPKSKWKDTWQVHIAHVLQVTFFHLWPQFEGA